MATKTFSELCISDLFYVVSDGFTMLGEDGEVIDFPLFKTGRSTAKHPDGLEVFDIPPDIRVTDDCKR